jgi:glycosyltransferase involved in cell wall biosynthesis
MSNTSAPARTRTAGLRRVLVLNYHFPPIGGAGSLRGVKLIRQLPELGYEPVVVTGPGLDHGRWRPKDDTLADEIAGVEVHRAGGPEPQRATGLQARVARWAARPEAWHRWLADALVEAGRGVRDVDLIYADLGPDATAEAAARLSRVLGCPWIADLQDPWALDEMRQYQSAAHRWIDRRRMRRALASASAVVMNTQEAAKVVRDSFPELAGTPVHALPYGYDGSDFRRAEPARDDAAFRIVHTGSFHTQLGQRYRRAPRLQRLLGAGAALPVDVLTRSPLYLVEAIRKVAREHASQAGRIELHLAGLLLDADRAVLDGCPGVNVVGFRSHAETVELMRSADLLFLPMQNLPPGVRARAVPCKAYEYLASGRPVLAAVPDGDGRDLLERAGNVFVVRPDDSDAMADAIAAELLRAERRPSVAAEREQLLRPLERRALNGRLAEVFDATLGIAHSELELVP